MLPLITFPQNAPFLSYSSARLALRKFLILFFIFTGLFSLGFSFEYCYRPPIGEEALECINNVGSLAPRPLDNISGCFDGNECVEVRADHVIEPVVDTGYSVLYVITAGLEMVILGTGPEPFFCIEDTGTYTIHTLVYNAETLDLSNVIPGQSTAEDIVGLIADHDTCAQIDLIGASFDIEPCDPCPDGASPDPGSLVSAPFGCFDGQNPVMITAETVVAPNIPDGFTFQYVLTQGEELSIISLSNNPIFSIGNTGLFRVHGLVYDPLTLDLDLVEFGTTTARDLVNSLGDSICAALDLVGTLFEIPPCIEDPCQGNEDISAGTLEAITTCLLQGEDLLNNADLVAEHIRQPNIPEGFTSLYVLTKGTELLIVDLSTEPMFQVSEVGLFRIHTLVYDSLSLDLSFVSLDTTTATQVLAILGDTICADLDVEGALFDLEVCPNEPCDAGVSPGAGSLIAVSDTCFDGENSVELVAQHNVAPQIPENFSSLYVLTQGAGLVIQDIQNTPSFSIQGTGLYTIHTLVYDPTALDLGIVNPGETTAQDVLNIISDSICAVLDVLGASFSIKSCTPPEDSVCFEVKDYILTTWGGDRGANFDHSLFFHHSPADPQKRMLGNRDFQQFFWESTGTYRVYWDEEGHIQDSASIFGVVFSEVDPSLKLKVDFRLINPMTWEEQQATGGGYKANLFSTETADTAHVNWTYWEISPRSRLTGMEALEGLVLELSHAPISRRYKLQVGYGANDKDGSFGLSGWFKYKGKFQGIEYDSQGDINVDIDTCIVRELCVYKEPEINETPILREVEMIGFNTPDPRISIVWSYFSQKETTFYVERRFEEQEFFESIGSFRAASRKFFFSFVDGEVSNANSYVYRIRAVQEGETESVSEARTLQIASQSYRLHPNPTDGRLQISPVYPAYGKHLIKIFSPQGQLLDEVEKVNFLDSLEWRLDEMSSGLYFIRIENPEGKAQILRFMKR